MRAYESKGRLARVHEDFKGEIIVAGDIHGDLAAFEGIRNIFRQARDPLLVFLGDYADRGPQGLEVIEEVKELIQKFGDRVIALKGNHEDYRAGVPYFSPCDLHWEVEEKRGIKWENFFPSFEHEFLKHLHLAVLIPDHSLLVHGGISSKIHNIEDLADSSEEIEEDILWSDPYEGEKEWSNPRGAGVLFNADVTKSLLKQIDVRYLIRSHEPRKAFSGPFVEHAGKVVTLSSTRVYGGKPFVLNFRPGSSLAPAELRRLTKYL